MPNANAPKKNARKRKWPQCHTCSKPIRVPDGWSAGAAVRRHYWSKHRAVMQPDLGGRDE